MSQCVVNNFVGGSFIAGSTTACVETEDPSTGEALARVTSSNAKDVDHVVKMASHSLPSWKHMSIKGRIVFLERFKILLSTNVSELADIITKESGRTVHEAVIEVQQGIELLGWAISLSTVGLNRQYEEMGPGQNLSELRKALGIIVAVLPSSSPVQALLESVPIALALGNCAIVKPSARSAVIINRISEIFSTAGIPPGVFQVIYGQADTVTALCDHSDVSAVTFVGTSQNAESVYKRCVVANKHVVTFGGSKNHVFALPGCEVHTTARDVVASFSACAGQRRLAASVLVLVGDGTEQVKKAFIENLVHEITMLAGKIESGSKLGQIGPVKSKAAQVRVLQYINEAEAAGCKILLDGRSWATERPIGYWVGPTVIMHTSADDRAMREEIFGPVLSVYCANSWDEAIAIENSCAYGCASSIYTENGSYAEWFIQRFRAGMVGINECYPPNREPALVSAATGTRSKFGSHDLAGEGALEFFSCRTRVSSRWVVANLRNGSAASPTRAVSFPVPPKSNNTSPITYRKSLSPLAADALPPMRRNSSSTTRDFSRENSATTEFSCESEADNTTVDHYGDPVNGKPTVFHGIAATSPFASSDSHFDFELERLKGRDPSFDPCYSVQPSFDIDPRVSMPMERENSDVSAMSGGSFLSRENSFAIQSSRKFHDVDLYAVDDLSDAQNSAMDVFVTSIGPLETQYKYRASATRFLKKQLRKALQCNVFETNLFALRCFLPTDSFRLSVVLVGRLEPCWQTLVRDGLIRVQNGENDTVPSSDGKHIISKIDVIRFGSQNEFKVTCMCDVTDVEITLNSRNDICMLAFLEEVDNLVGMNNLFKRSLMLIRAWWEYDTTDSFESPVTRQLLDEFAMSVMVAAIFNQYHSRISTPLQALSLFLAEYSNYVGENQVVTLQGIVPFTTTDGVHFNTIEPSRKHLFSNHLLDKYSKVFNVEDAYNKSPMPSSPGAVVPFQREHFHVLHPFLGTNMVRTGKLAERRSEKLAKAFTDGARNFSLAVSKSAGESDSAPAAELVDIFLPISKARFANVTRPDAIVVSPEVLASASSSPTARTTMSVSVDKLWQGILYCNFIIKSVVSESAILTFCIDVLSMMGLLTADDLGKRLNEASKVPQVMVTLKEQVGGLKEFLKRYSDVFIFSYEHPYNPHVFLRISLTPELQAEVENGVLPVKFLSHIIAKFGRIAPPPPKVDSPGLRRGKVMAQQAAHPPYPPTTNNNFLDEKVVFGHERSAGGANTLRLMQSDLDLASVNNPISPNGLLEADDKNIPHNSLPGPHNPFAQPFVPQQGPRAIGGPDKLGMRKPTVLGAGPAAPPGASQTSPLTIPNSSPFYQDLSLMSNSVLNGGMGLGMQSSANPNNSGNNNSLGLLFQGSEGLDGFLDTASDFFGDLNSGGSLGGGSQNSSVSGHLDLLSGLHEPGNEDYSQEINLSVNPALSAAALGPRGNGGAYGPGSSGAGGRGSRYSTQFQTSEIVVNFDTVPGLDAYHQTNGGNSLTKVRGHAYPASQGQSNPDLYRKEDYNDGYTGAYGSSYQQQGGGGDMQQGYHYGSQYNNGAQRGLTRTNSRPLMLSQQQQMQQQQGGVPKFQHKRYDVAQQFKK